MSRGSHVDTVLHIVRMPDGRWGTRNARDISDLKQRDIIEILSAFGTWASAQLDAKSARERGDPEVDDPDPTGVGGHGEAEDVGSSGSSLIEELPEMGHTWEPTRRHPGGDSQDIPSE